MLVIKPYQRERAVAYAERYAFSQNPLFGNFRGIGGNCTNFVSQAIYAAGCTMNFTPTFGWYYVSLNDRSPSWTGVDYFYSFMTTNEGVGPFGKEIAPDMSEIGDVIQLGREADGYYHTLLIVGYSGDDPLVAAQTDDAFRRPLSTYTYDYSRFIKIEGIRINIPDTADCYGGVLSGSSLTPGGAPLQPVSPMPEPAIPAPNAGGGESPAPMQAPAQAQNTPEADIEEQ